MPTPTRDFKNILSEFLKLNEMSQREFARKINVHFTNIGEWLHGRSKPSYDNIKQIVQTFEAHANYWLGLEDVY